jgi:hypothetical protein
MVETLPITVLKRPAIPAVHRHDQPRREFNKQLNPLVRFGSRIVNPTVLGD